MKIKELKIKSRDRWVGVKDPIDVTLEFGSTMKSEHRAKELRNFLKFLKQW